MMFNFLIRHWIAFGLVFFMHYYPNAQVKEENHDYNQTYLPQGRDSRDPVYLFYEEMPTIEGGIQAVREFIRQAPYPECGLKDTIQRLVVLQFVVERDGSITDMTVVRSPDVCYLQAATKYMAQTPRWQPGRRDGVIVPCLYTLPISYQFKND